MAYVRMSVAKPRRGEEARVEEIFERINTEAAKNDGCLETYLLHPHDDSGEVARMAIYTDEDAAEAAASNDAVLAPALRDAPARGARARRAGLLHRPLAHPSPEAEKRRFTKSDGSPPA